MYTIYFLANLHVLFVAPGTIVILYEVQGPDSSKLEDDVPMLELSMPRSLSGSGPKPSFVLSYANRPPQAVPPYLDVEISTLPGLKSSLEGGL